MGLREYAATLPPAEALTEAEKEIMRLESLMEPVYTDEPRWVQNETRKRNREIQTQIEKLQKEVVRP